MKKRLRIAMIIVICVMCIVFCSLYFVLYGCNTHEKATGNQDTVHGGMYVDGTYLRMPDGTPVVLRGINHSHCWYKDYDEIAFDAIANTKANSIRIVLADGDQWEADTAEEVKQVIEMARERNLIAVVEVHDATGSDDLEKLHHATDYWIGLSEVLKGTEGYCILNIANEWVGGWNSTLWKEGYTEAIPKLRGAGIKNVIMVDAAGWGQYGKSVRAKGLEVFESDPDKNTMFSVHMYGLSGRYRWLIRYNLLGATEQNLCVCVGEFGYTHSDGNVKEDYLMEYCEKHGIGTLAWSFKGNSEEVEYLDLSRDWEGTELSPQWGEKVVNGEYGIKNTATRFTFD